MQCVSMVNLISSPRQDGMALKESIMIIIIILEQVVHIQLVSIGA